MAPDDEISELDTDDSLPDPFTPKEQPKMSGTKEDQGAENIQEPQEMGTMPELISDDDGDTPPKTFVSKNPTSIPKTSPTNQRCSLQRTHPHINHATNRPPFVSPPQF